MMTIMAMTEEREYELEERDEHEERHEAIDRVAGDQVIEQIRRNLT